MQLRDKIFLLVGGLIATLGVIATFLWTVSAGVGALLLLGLMILMLLVLERRQLAKIQERSLHLLRVTEKPKRTPYSEDSTVRISTKKIIGMLQAHQVSLDLLAEKIDSEALDTRKTKNHPRS